MTYTCTYRNFMLVQISRRSYRAYSFSEVPVGTIDQNDTHLYYRYLFFFIVEVIII